MLADSTNPRPDVQESYYSATGTSTMKVVSHRRTPADLIIAAGMSKRETGGALLRLVSEWDRSAKPVQATQAQIEALAKAKAVEPPGSAHAGMVREQLQGGEVRFRLPMDVAKEEAATWYEHELGILLQGLKSLPTVRSALSRWLAGSDDEKAMHEASHVIARVLIWWLDPKCHLCRGVAQRVVKGTGRTSGKACGACRGTGESKVPHGGLGKSVLGHIRGCIHVFRQDLQGKFQHQKPDRRSRGDRHELLVMPGQRWRARDGQLWDVPLDGNEGGSAQKLLAVLVTDPTVKKLYHCNGYPFGPVRIGLTGADLIELVGGVP